MKGDMLFVKREDIVPFDEIDYTFLLDMHIREDGEFQNLALWLNDKWDYILGKDSKENIILVRIKKETKQ